MIINTLDKNIIYRMVKYFQLFSILFSPLLLSAQTWSAQANLIPSPGTGRDATVALTIGTKIYVGTGGSWWGLLKDWWEYDPVGNTWTQMADYGGVPIEGACGFAIGTKGYVGTGFDGSVYRVDFWEYDQGLNSWSQVADFGGAARHYAVGMAIGSKGYVGTGQCCFSDWWEFDRTIGPTGTWAAKASYPGGNQQYAVGFSLGGYGYLGLGNIPLNNLFYKYDPVGNSWSAIANYPGTARWRTVACATSQRGYVGGIGLNAGSGDIQDFYEYNPSANSWTIKTSFAGTARSWGAATSINDCVYMGMGFGGSGSGGCGCGGYWWDWWKFCPTLLPVEFISLEARCRNRKVQLIWATASEHNNDYFEVQRNRGGSAEDWKIIEKINGAGNSSTIRKYEFFDHPFENNKAGDVLYRLKQVDFDGAFEYSSIKFVSHSCENENGMTILPNPSSGIFTVNTSSAISELKVYSSLGECIYSRTGQPDIIDISCHENGIYFLKVICGSNAVSQKIIVSK